MKALFIGGTGTISTAVSALAVEKGIELTLLNRGTHLQEVPKGARVLRGDIRDEAAVASLLKDETFDVVSNFINFVPEQIERDIRLFSGKN